MPSSILSNNSQAYIGAREQILSNFYIRAITCFGSKTFGATGTNTVVLFMERFHEPPVQKQLATDTANAILFGNLNDEWEDREILHDYLSLIGVTEEQYQHFAAENYSIDDLREIEYFKAYVDDFERTRQIYAKSLTPEQIIVERQDRLYKRMKEVEKEKLIYFTLIRGQETIVITAPSDNAEQKVFLGYDWSNRKGSEGIVLNSNGGYLTNSDNRFAHGTLASYIRNAFNGMHTTMVGESELQKYVATYRTADMLDFSKATFDKAIKTTPDKKIEIKSKYPLVTLGSIAEILKGKSITKSQVVEGNIKVVAGGVDYAYLHNEANREAGTITISASGANAGYVNYWDEPIFASDCTTVRGQNKQQTLFLFNYLQAMQEQIYLLQKGAAQPHVYPDDIKAIQVPNISVELQQQIVTECQKVDEEYNNSRMAIEDYRKRIAQAIASVDKSVGNEYRIKNVCKNIFAGGDKPTVFSEVKKDECIVPIYSNGVENDGLFGYTDKPRVSEKCVTISARGTLGFTVVHSEPFLPIVRLIVAIPNDDIIKAEYLKYAIDQVNLVNTGGTTPQLTVPNIAEVSIFVPSIDIQQQIISQVEQYEAQIAAAQAVMDSCQQRKADILNKYLN